MEATDFSETSVMIYQTTMRHNPEDNSFDSLEFAEINLLYEQRYVIRSVGNFKEENFCWSTFEVPTSIWTQQVCWK